MTPETIKGLRIKHNLTQQQAGALVFKTTAAWCHYEKGIRTISEGTYELFLIKLKGLK